MNFCGPATTLRKLPHTDNYDYGFLPPRFVNQVLDAFVRLVSNRPSPRHAAGMNRYTVDPNAQRRSSLQHNPVTY